MKLLSEGGKAPYGGCSYAIYFRIFYQKIIPHTLKVFYIDTIKIRLNTDIGYLSNSVKYFVICT